VRATFDAHLVEICLWDEEQAVEHVFTLLQGRFQENSVPVLADEFTRRIRIDEAIVCGQEETGHVCTEAAALPLRALLGVALHFGHRQIGSLGVGSIEPDAYDGEDVRLLQVVGGQVSTAIQNARLFAEVETGRETILRSRNTLQALFDGILDGIYIVDRHNQVLAINRAQALRAKRTWADLVGRPAHIAFPMSERSQPLIEETFRTGEPNSCTERQLDANGRWTEWEIQTYPVTRAGERQTGHLTDRVVVVVRDVTEQRWLETSLARSEKLASVGRLAAGVAHEINNPMAVISANAQILREELSTAHPYYSSIELIDRASERASRIVRNLLDFSRAEEFEFVQTDLNLSLRDAISLVEPQIRRSNIEITIDLDPDLPAISASPDHLQVAWLNMLLNARDAIEAAGREGAIRVSSTRRDDQVVVRIADDGIGIPAEDIEHVYDPFFTTKPPGKGTGLGLFTCYRTVQRHGGEIHIDSRVGQGTTFEITLPVSPQ
jgi:signal transduction histidine kinase